MSNLHVLGQPGRPFDVPLLRAPVAAAQQDHDLLAAPRQIHPIAGTEVNRLFDDIFGDLPAVAEVTYLQRIQTTVDDGSALRVAQSLDPLHEAIGSVYLEHGE